MHTYAQCRLTVEIGHFYPVVDILDKFVHVLEVDVSCFVPEVVSHGQHDVVSAVMCRLATRKHVH